MSINCDLLPEMVAPPPKVERNIKEQIPDPDFPDPEEDRIKMREKYDKEADEISDEIDYAEGTDEEEEIVPEPKKRVIIPKKDIFKSAESVAEVPVVQKVKQKRKPRGPATEKQLEALARARAKGAETRRKKAEEKRKIKELENEVKRQEMEEKKKSLQRKLKKPVLKEEEYAEANEEEYAEEKPKVYVEAKPPVNKKIVEDTIEKAVEKGIAEYEMKRKARKEEKKKRLEKEAYDKKVLNTVHKAIDPDKYWEQCFR